MASRGPLTRLLHEVPRAGAHPPPDVSAGGSRKPLPLGRAPETPRDDVVSLREVLGLGPSRPTSRRKRIGTAFALLVALGTAIAIWSIRSIMAGPVATDGGRDLWIPEAGAPPSLAPMTPLNAPLSDEVALPTAAPTEGDATSPPGPSTTAAAVDHVGPPPPTAAADPPPAAPAPPTATAAASTAPPATAPPAPTAASNPATAPAEVPVGATFGAPGGSVSVDCRAAVITLRAAKADAGFTARIDDSGPDRVRVRFVGATGGGRDGRLRVVCVNGTPAADQGDG